MAKVIVITDSEGGVLGSVRGDLIETNSGTIQFQPLPGPHKYHEIDLSEDIMRMPAEELHREFERRLRTENS
jgi:hypothetical protein